MTEQTETTVQALELKGRMMTLTVLRLLTPDVKHLGRELEQRMQQAPDFFRQLPLILDVEAVADTDLHLDLPGFVGLLRAREFLPVGIRGGDDRWRSAAEQAGIGVFTGGSEAPAARRAEPEPAATPEPETSPSTTVLQQVRSGQQVYARGGDLIILSSVSPGAEVLADGNIHIYGGLYGRALAGVRGDTGARIFCMGFNAELVTVAGTYLVNEQFDKAYLGQAVQVLRDGEELRIRPLPGVNGGR
ncbi:septum site-determining protein MinC [Aquisalimonas asiatica]|uniref:Probable septum site-determining protein MinC n=1 Tax=Aquisalimonas asiatica TaxID=406100 RepID=A0A1H8VRA2_9GAMM|nr:septum site-determining protein MinC [Aquisalimonas asiatica]SEP17478.1 septum site-determining protein MinC [Aquisalimonas asiatica]